jgi:hypothetical protein
VEKKIQAQRKPQEPARERAIEVHITGMLANRSRSDSYALSGTSHSPAYQS